MNKPFSIIRDEFSTQLADLVNSCELPPSVMADILERFHKSTVEIAEMVLKNDLEEFEKMTKIGEGEDIASEHPV